MQTAYNYDELPRCAPHFTGIERVDPLDNYVGEPGGFLYGSHDMFVHE